MHFVHPVVVGADQRTYQQHRGAGGAHDARQQSADGEDGRVGPRVAVQIAADMNAARYREQRDQQQDERNVLSEQCMHKLMRSRRGAEHGHQRQQKRKRPTQRHLAVMPVPEVRRNEWQQCDRQQQPGKGQRPHHGQRGSFHQRCPVVRAVTRAARSQTPGAGRPDISRLRTCSWMVCPTAWQPAGHCSGSS